MGPRHRRDLRRRHPLPKSQPEIVAGHSTVAAVENKGQAAQGLADRIRDAQGQVCHGKSHPDDQPRTHQIDPRVSPLHPTLYGKSASKIRLGPVRPPTRLSLMPPATTVNGTSCPCSRTASLSVVTATVAPASAMQRAIVPRSEAS